MPGGALLDFSPTPSLFWIDYLYIAQNTHMCTERFTGGYNHAAHTHYMQRYLPSMITV